MGKREGLRMAKGARVMGGKKVGMVKCGVKMGGYGWGKWRKG